LRNRIQSQLGDACRLSATVAFDHPTVAAMTQFLLSQIANGAGAPPARPSGKHDPQTDRPAVRRNDPVDEADLDAVLLKKFNLHST
jgi:hypothetical protein